MFISAASSWGCAPLVRAALSCSPQRSVSLVRVRVRVRARVRVGVRLRVGVRVGV